MGRGVEGVSVDDVGVVGSSDTYIGVYGYSFATAQPGLAGEAAGNSTGVLGFSGDPLPAAKPKTGMYGYANQDTTANGVFGESPLGVGVRGKTSSGYAGYFQGKVFTTHYLEMAETAMPATPIANRARLFTQDDGTGKTRLCVKFPNGVVRVLATM